MPTGLGKTSCIHIAVYELARQLHTKCPRTAPLRIYHVIDRNSVVLQSADEVTVLAKALNDRADDVLKPVAAALATALPPLHPSEKPGHQAVKHHAAVARARYDGTLRVGDPQRTFGCMITSMTAHQFMSRILFRGFGVGAKNRSIDAGLTGVDSLVLFDEPHLSEPSLSALADITRLQGPTTQIGLPGLQVVTLGATRRPSRKDERAPDPSSVFAYEPGAGAGRASAAEHRFSARRDITLSMVTGKGESAFTKQIVNHVRDYCADEPSASIGVIVNTVAMAQNVAGRLRELGLPVDLITSRVRPIDREARLPEHAGNPARVTVATQCIEVGVDLSFDHLITEACPMPSFIQRVGRLNRFGSPDSPGTGFLVTGQTNKKAVVRDGTAAVYGPDSVVETVRYLGEVAQDGVIDASLRAQQEWSENAGFWPEDERHATLTDATVDYLTITSPPVKPDVLVDAFILGPDARPNTDVRVAWRAILGTDELADCRPLNGEFVSVPIGALRPILEGSRRSAVGLSDAGGSVPEEQAPQSGPIPDYYVRVDGSWLQHGSLAPGRDVVIDADAGGYTPDGWNPSSRSPVDDLSAVGALGEVAPPRTLAFPLIEATLLPVVERGWISTDFVASLLSRIEDTEEFDPTERAALKALINDELDRFDTDGPKRARISDVVLEQSGQLLAQIAAATNKTIDGRSQLLDDHLAQVGEWAREDATAIGLPKPLVDDIATAGRFHDIGKAAAVWQRIANRGRVPDQPTAKYSYRVPAGRWISVARSLGFPLGWRHESLSYLLGVLYGLSPLACHLIGSHHGWFRPFVRPVDGPGDLLTDAEKQSQLLGADYSDTFAALNSEFGPWGLAYLEAVLRLSDWRASEYPAKQSTSAEPVQATQSMSTEQAPASGEPYRNEIELTGLTSTPTAGWFAVLGLLGAAERRGIRAAVCWRPVGGADDRPSLPVLRLDAELADLVADIWSGDWFWSADKLVRDHLDQDLFVKSHKIADPSKVRDLLREADASTSLVTGVINDTVSAVPKFELAIPAIANNSSFGPITRRALEFPSADGFAALTDTSAGYIDENFDGGFDRPTAIQPLVNGIGEHGKRQSRGFLAPFILNGFAALGMPPAGGHGVSRRTLILPLPGRFTTLPALRTLTRLGAQPQWAWSAIDCEWILHGQIIQPTKYEKCWNVEYARRPERNS
ncbi:helicase-related protein [Gordonia sp. (in: high G+C Gram-positive bacteria)]|uniref:type I-G CRISPR-associated helicase/endonuclease Cas3g n=1 Tax=Gordonia sp. (in: high G+C Gram-positive bacteria) TaxID=84139 RepID=UPI003527455F